MSASVSNPDRLLARIRDLRLVPLALALWGTTILALFSFAWILVWIVVVAGVLGIFGIAVPRWPWMRTVGLHLVVTALLVGVQALALSFMQTERDNAVSEVLAKAGAGIRFNVVTVDDPVAVKDPGFGVNSPVTPVSSEPPESPQLPESSESAGPAGSPGSAADPTRRYAIQATVTSIAGNPHRERITIFAPGTWAGLAPGTQVSTYGTFRLQEQPNRSLYSVGVRAPPQVSSTDALMESTNEWRASLANIASSLGPGAKELLPGMVIGDTTNLTEKLSEEMKVSGLTHLLTVSGANCTYILAFVWLCFRVLKVPRALASVLGALVLVGFVLIVRPEPSVIRAAVMGALGAFAIMNGRSKVAFNVLVVSVVILLLVDPWLALQYGFALSVAATLGLIVLSPALANRLGRWMPGWLATAVSIPLSAQIAVTPILLGLQDYVGVYAVLANLAVGIMVPFITVLGMLAMCVGQLAGLLANLGVPLVPDTVQLAAQVIATPAGWGTEVIAAVARLIAAMPLAKLPWLEGAAGIVLALVLVALIVLWAFELGPRLKAATERWIWRQPRLKRLSAWSRRRESAPGSPGFSRAVVVLVVAAFAATWWLVPLGNSGVAEADVLACDVGQGDGALVKTGADTALVFDAGVEPGTMSECLQRAGVKRVEVLFLTHDHADHVGGAQSVLANFEVGRLVYSSTGVGLKPVLDAAAARNVPVEQGTVGMTGTAGDEAANSISWTILWPIRAPIVDPSGSGGEGSAENNVSLVVRVDMQTGAASGTVSALFTGDIEEEAAVPLLRSQSPQFWASIGILKVAHHGSAGSGTEMIDAIRPRIALISVGQDNDYGHPRPEILEALERVGARILRTDIGGEQLVRSG